MCKISNSPPNYKERIASNIFIILNYDMIKSTLDSNSSIKLQNKNFYEDQILNDLCYKLKGKKFLEFKITFMSAPPFTQEFCSALNTFINYNLIVAKNGLPLKYDILHYRNTVFSEISKMFKDWNPNDIKDAFEQTLL